MTLIPATPARVSAQQRALGIAADFLAAIMWGFTGIIVYLSKTESIVLTFYRLWIATTIMVLALLLSRRRLSWHVLLRAAPAGVLLV